ncbi:MAG: hypothetical protein LBE70_00070 [Nitrososphaerota archaeon]|jgi:hypothetical protein|nr:hypothetical protein [Nitrososphaerota archaeon]
MLNKSGFKLPRVEKEKFTLLMRLGLEYNSQKMLFSIKHYNNISQLQNVLQDILKSEIAFTQTCTICHTDFGCSTCKYSKTCPTKDLPFSCICNQCLRPKKACNNNCYSNKQHLNPQSTVKANIKLVT